jgi:hypothetical protein
MMERSKMKKIVIALIMSLMLVNVCFSLTWAEKLLLPEFTGNLDTTPHKIVEESVDVTVIEIDGIVYIVKK